MNRLAKQAHGRNRRKEEREHTRSDFGARLATKLLDTNSISDI